MLKKIIKSIGIAFVILYIFLLSAVSVFCSEPQGEPACVEWERGAK